MVTPIGNAALASQLLNSAEPLVVKADPNSIGGWRIMCGEIVVHTGFGAHTAALLCSEDFELWRQSVRRDMGINLTVQS